MTGPLFCHRLVQLVEILEHVERHGILDVMVWHAHIFSHVSGFLVSMMVAEHG